MPETAKPTYFQNHMPGNVCFGCGNDNPDGLQIKSYWVGQEAHCQWQPEEHHHGWANLLNGGVLATIIDCHCMGTAMADAHRKENRPLGSEPEYRYATGSLSIRYIKPTYNDSPVLLKATVTEQKGKKTVMRCDVYSKDEHTATAEVVAIRVFDGSQSKAENPFKS